MEPSDAEILWALSEENDTLDTFISDAEVNQRDLVYAGAGNDTVTTSTGNDTIYGELGDDVIDGGIGDDFLIGGLGGDTLLGGAGNDLILPDKNINFGDVAPPNDGPLTLDINIIDGGAGNDTIRIGDHIANPRSQNEILFGRGSDHDLVDFNEQAVAPEDLDSIVLVFKSGLSPSDIELDIAPSQQPFAFQEDIIFRIIDTGETLTLDADFGVFPHLISIRFEDGDLPDYTLDNEGVAFVAAQTQGDQTVRLDEVLNMANSDTRTDVPNTFGFSNFIASDADENLLLDGLSQHVQSIITGGGSDCLVLAADANHANNLAGSENGHYRIRDLVIDSVANNSDADILDIGQFLLGNNLNASNIGNYLHIVSGAFGNERSIIFIDKDGQFTDQDRVNLNNNPSEGGFGADLVLEFQGRAANNNIEELTGFADNTEEQFQALIDLGFLDVSKADSPAPERPEEPEVLLPLMVFGSENAERLEGSDRDDIFLSGGLVEGVETIVGNGGRDRLVLAADDARSTDNADDNHSHFRIRDFTIADTEANRDADVLDISDLLSDINNTEDLLGHLHVVSGSFGNSRASIFIDVDGTFDDQERAALNADVAAGGQGADLFLEFQGNDSNNNLAQITGHADNSIEQLQALLDMGFIDIT